MPKFSIANIFGTNSTPAPAPVANPIAAPTTVIPDPTVVADPNNPNAPAVPVATVVDPAKEPAPLDLFKDIWDDVPLKDGEKPPVKAAPLNVADVQKAVGKADFAAVLTPENLELVAAGGEEAKAAFVSSLNAVAQNAVVQSTMISNKLAEKTIKEAVQAQLKDLPKMLRDASSTDHLITNHPLLTNPAIKPMAEATKARLLEHFPDASNEKIAEMTVNFIKEAGKLVTPEVTPKPKAGEVDWDKFLTEE